VPSISPAKEFEASKAFCANECAFDLKAFSVKAKDKYRNLVKLAKEKLKAYNTPTTRRVAVFVLGGCCGVVVDHLFIKCG
jgi:methionine synthase I (cobalamin-dependent)